MILVYLGTEITSYIMQIELTKFLRGILSETTPKVAPKNTHSLQISISAHSHHTSTNSSVILNGIFIPCSKACQALSRLGATVRVHPRPGAYATSGYLRSSDISTRGHSRGMGPC